MEDRVRPALRTGDRQKPLSDAGVRDAADAAAAEETSRSGRSRISGSATESIQSFAAPKRPRRRCAPSPGAELFRRAGTLPLMYHCIGLVARTSRIHLRILHEAEGGLRGGIQAPPRRADRGRHGVPSPGGQYFTIWNCKAAISSAMTRSTRPTGRSLCRRKRRRRKSADTIAWRPVSWGSWTG